MLFQLLYQGQYAVFALIVITLIISLTFHEYAHAAAATVLGDNTPKMQNRLNINPINHIDPMGLLFVCLAGFGYAKPVMTNPRNFKSKHAMPLVAVAGPAMNLLLAFITINVFFIGQNAGVAWFSEPGPVQFFFRLAQINLVLMLFNMIPIGPLDGHYILQHVLPTHLSYKYQQFNNQYGMHVLMGLVLLSIAGLPIFSQIFSLATNMMMKLAIFA